MFSQIGFPVIKNYSRKDYKADSQNWDAVQDTNGFMLFGNNNGILVYDGTAWQTVRLGKNKLCRALVMGKDNRIYCGGLGELGYVQSSGPGVYSAIMLPLPDSLRNFDLRKGVSIGDSIIFQTDFHLIIYSKGKTDIIYFGNFIQSLHVANDKIWVHLPDLGLHHLINRKLIPVEGAGIYTRRYISGLLPLEENRYLICLEGGIITSFENNKPQIIDNPDFRQFEGVRFTDLIQYDTSTFILATKGMGMILLDKSFKVLQIIDKKAGLSHQSIQKLYKSRNGGLWACLDNGFSKIKLHLPFKLLDSRSGIDGAIYSIAEYDGRLFFGTNTGLYTNTKQNPDKFIKLNNIIPPIWSIQPARTGLLIGTSTGLYYLNPLNQEKIIFSKDQFLTLVPSLFDNNVFFLGTQAGFSIIEQNAGQWKQAVGTYKTNCEIRNILEMPDSNLLVSSLDKIFLINKNKTKQTRDYLIDKKKVFHLTKPFLFTFNQRIFISSNDVIYEFVADTLKKLIIKTVDMPFTSWRLGNAVIDPKTKRCWMNISDSSDLLFTVVRVIPDNDTVRLVPDLGLRALVPLHFGVYALYSSPVEDRLWLGGDVGAFFYEFKKIWQPVKPNPAIILPLRAFNRESPSNIIEPLSSNVNELWRLEYYYNSVAFRFSFPSFDFAENNKFRYRLSGLHVNWSEWTHNNEHTFSNLEPGDYTLEVQAQDVYGQMSPISTYRFFIKSPWYRTVWGWSLWTLVTGLLLYVGIRWWNWQLELQKINLEKKVKIRTAELEDAYAAISEQKAELSWANYSLQIAYDQLEEDNRRKTTEIEEARTLQLSMLPAEVPTYPNLQIAVYMKTATEVGGDYYDFVTDKQGAFKLAIGDATGHGLRAAFVVSAVKSYFQTLAPTQNLEVILDNISLGVYHMQLNEMFMAMTLVKFNAGKLEMIQAGLPPVFWYRADQKKLVKISKFGLWLGTGFDIPYTKTKLRLAQNDCFLFTTDGLSELQQKNNPEVLFGYNRIAKVFATNAHKPAQLILKSLLRAAERWSGKRPYADDMTLIVLKYTGKTVAKRSKTHENQ